MKVIVNTDPAPGEMHRLDDAKIIDWTNSSDRKWLTNHLHWAMHNNRTVTLSRPDAH